MLSLLIACSFADVFVVPGSGESTHGFTLEANPTAGFNLAASKGADVDDLEGFELKAEVFDLNGDRVTSIPEVTLSAVPDTKGRFWVGKLAIPAGLTTGEYTVKVSFSDDWKDKNGKTIIAKESVSACVGIVAAVPAAA